MNKNLTEREIEGFREQVAAGKTVYVAGRSASTEAELDFAIEAARNTADTAQDAATRAGVLRAPSHGVTRRDLDEALKSMTVTLDAAPVQAAIEAAIAPLYDTLSVVVAERDAVIAEQADQIGSLRAANDASAGEIARLTAEVQSLKAAASKKAPAAAAPAPAEAPKASDVAPAPASN
jgi:hypothetical protein